MKVAYIWAMTIQDLFLFALAVFSPVYITPGFYWWTGLALSLIAVSSVSFTNRINKWESKEDSNDVHP